MIDRILLNLYTEEIFMFLRFCFLVTVGIIAACGSGGGGNSSPIQQANGESTTASSTSSTTSSTTFGVTTTSTILTSSTTSTSTSTTVLSTTSTTIAQVAIANAGNEQIVTNGSIVNLSGIGSLNALTYSWILQSKPTNSTAVLINPNTVNPYFIADVPGTFIVSLIVSNGTSNSSSSAVNIVSATPIGGIYNTSTTLNKSNSPYVLTNDIQIAYGTTFLIQDGVEIYGNNHNITLFGNLSIIGVSTNLVKIHSLFIYGGTNSPTTPYILTIDYAEINNNSSLLSPTGNSSYGSLTLRHSIIKDTAKYYYTYIWYPVSDCFIENNIFVNAGGFSIGVNNGVTVHISNNAFYKWQITSGSKAAVRNWASYGTSTVIVEYNSFLSTDQIALSLPSGYTNAAMTATNNYFGTIDTSIIDSMIYDKNDDLGSAGYILYSPFLTAPDLNTPDITPYL